MPLTEELERQVAIWTVKEEGLACCLPVLNQLLLCPHDLLFVVHFYLLLVLRFFVLIAFFSQLCPELSLFVAHLIRGLCAVV